MRAVAIKVFAALAMVSVMAVAARAGEQKIFFDHVATPMEYVAPEVSGTSVPPQENVDAKGTIQVVRDKFQRIEQVIFTSDAGQAYVVKLSGQGRMLSTADGKTVEISGKSKDTKDGVQLVVSRFTLLK